EEIVFIILSRDDSRDKVIRFMENKGYDLPVYMAAGPTPKEFQSRVIPSTFIISPGGEIVSEQSGMADYNNEQVREFLIKLTERL
ncbi:MAG: TlpA family protein disulfide reductase, partial [Cyclobacteriaceae bacterium]